MFHYDVRSSKKDCQPRLYLGPKLTVMGQVVSCIAFMALFVIFYTSRSEPQHISIISATYFKNSSIYPQNTMVVLFNSQRAWIPQKSLVCKSFIQASDQDKRKASDPVKLKELAHVQYMTLPTFVCSWNAYVITCPVVENPTGFALTDTGIRSRQVSIPFRKAVTENLGLVACFSPLFYFERWQVMFPSLEIYRQFGVSRQVYYIQSIREEIYELLQAYKYADAVDIEPWTIMEFGDTKHSVKDPNLELEWRNQAGAHTDCYLKYREAAEFIIISDIDDVLIPRHGSYLHELHSLVNQYPSAAAFTFGRYNTAIQSDIGPDHYSLQNLLDNARITMSQREDGKSVVRTSAVQTVWIHWPAIIKEGYKVVSVDEGFDFMVHLRNWTNTQPNVNSFTKDEISLHTVILSQNVSKLSYESARFISMYAKKEFKALPDDSVYYKLIEKCYNEMFYSRARRPAQCPGPARCKLPTNLPGIGCAVAEVTTMHSPINDYAIVHFPQTEKKIVIHSDGCRSY
uniref:Glycosyltransferase family 92 protein n=1 Tax=Panagrellus redivivus TaxID=6233 RepID=A0A7E4VSZ3_PANRE